MRVGGAAKGMQVPPKASKAQDLHLTPSVPSDTECFRVIPSDTELG